MKIVGHFIDLLFSVLFYGTKYFEGWADSCFAVDEKALVEI